MPHHHLASRVPAILGQSSKAFFTNIFNSLATAPTFLPPPEHWSSFKNFFNFFSSPLPTLNRLSQEKSKKIKEMLTRSWSQAYQTQSNPPIKNSSHPTKFPSCYHYAIFFSLLSSSTFVVFPATVFLYYLVFLYYYHYYSLPSFDFDL